MSLRQLLPSPLYRAGSAIITAYYKLNPNAWRIARWKKEGKPNPPPHVIKEKTIRKYSGSFRVFVETGTYMGDMVKAMKGRFHRIYSIELDEAFYKTASEKFRSCRNIEILQGDSGKVLPSLLRRIGEPAVFWLDGHYSGGSTAKGELVTPIMKELAAISEHASSHKLRHLILIDDAHLFNGTDDYPTLQQMENIRQKFFPHHAFFIENNIIVLKP